MGREADRALRQDAYRSENQDHGVFGRAQRAAGGSAVRVFQGRSQTAFGIGTNLTNDLGYKPIQIVIKMTRCNGQPVAKISDEPSKAMDYDPSYVAYLREVFQVPESPAEPVEEGVDAE